MASKLKQKAFRLEEEKLMAAGSQSCRNKVPANAHSLMMQVQAPTSESSACSTSNGFSAGMQQLGDVEMARVGCLAGFANDGEDSEYDARDGSFAYNI
jgi:hypothetical protein